MQARKHIALTYAGFFSRFTTRLFFNLHLSSHSLAPFTEYLFRFEDCKGSSHDYTFSPRQFMRCP